MVSDRDLGWGELVRQLTEVNRRYVKAGFPSDGSVKNGNNGRNHSYTMSEIAVIGAIQEFGAPRAGTPPRPFLSTAFDSNLDGFMSFSEMLKIGIGNQTVSYQQVLEATGVWWVDRIRETIVGHAWEQNAPSTKRAKGSSRPLIDTAQMINSVQARIE